MRKPRRYVINDYVTACPGLLSVERVDEEAIKSRDTDNPRIHCNRFLSNFTEEVRVAARCRVNRIIPSAGDTRTMMHR